MSVSPRVAFVHDWLTGMRGGEKVLDALLEVYPDADVFTLVHLPGQVSPAIERRPIHQAFVGRLPGAGRLYRHLLPSFPIAVETFDLDRFDLVVSTSHCAAKSAVPPPGVRHLCYCHSPMRYAWDQYEAYFGWHRLGPGTLVMRPVMRALARWDAATACRPDRYVANSQHVARRIARYYNRQSAVVHPPVDVGFYEPAPVRRTHGFLVVSALVPYKRIDVAVDACARVGAPLTIVGQGPEAAALRRRASADVTFLGPRTDEEIRQLYRQARAVLLPGEEDFGIVPVEAQACGTPVVALARGGALETVVHGQTGLLVESPAVEAFAEALASLDGVTFDPAVIRSQAEAFGRERFVRQMRAECAALLGARPEAARW